MHRPLFKETWKPLFKGLETGRDHAMKWEDLDPTFSKFLRENYYNVELSGEAVATLRREWKTSQIP